MILLGVRWVDRGRTGTIRNLGERKRKEPWAAQTRRAMGSEPLAEAIIALFCLVDDAYALLDRSARHYERAPSGSRTRRCSRSRAPSHVWTSCGA